MPPKIQDHQHDTRDIQDITGAQDTLVACRVETQPAGAGTLLRVSGEVELVTAPLLRAAARRALTERPGGVHLDLGAVTFIDCAGLGALIAISNAARRAGLPRPGITTSGAVRRLLALTDTGHLFDLDPPAHRTQQARTERAQSMTTHRADTADDTWLTPRETERPHLPGAPMPAEVRRDLADILRDATPTAHVWQPIPYIPGHTAELPPHPRFSRHDQQRRDRPSPAFPSAQVPEPNGTAADDRDRTARRTPATWLARKSTHRSRQRSTSRSRP